MACGPGAAATRRRALADEADVVLSSTPSIQVRIDANGDGVVGASEVTDLTLAMGADNVLTGAATTIDTDVGPAARRRAHRSGQPAGQHAARPARGGDRLTLVHADIDRNGIVDAADATGGRRWRLPSSPAAARSWWPAAARCWLRPRATRRCVEQLTCSRRPPATASTTVDLSALPGATLNLGPARGRPRAGGGLSSRSRRIDANALTPAALPRRGRRWA
jgi:hypothetical protein